MSRYVTCEGYRRDPKLSNRQESGRQTVIDHEWIEEVAEVLAGALHDHNIGRDVRGWRDVAEAFDSLKAILGGRYV